MLQAQGNPLIIAKTTLLLRGKGGLLHGYRDVKRWAVEPIYVDILIALWYSQRENGGEVDLSWVRAGGIIFP